MKGKRRELVTRDLLGGSKAVLGSAEVDLELRVPVGWERSLDLLSGRTTYLRKNDGKPTPRPGHIDGLALAFRPPSSAALFLSRAVAPSRRIPPAYQSVCTLEKVRSALQRAEREEQPDSAVLGFSASPSSSITSTSSFNRRTAEEDVIVLDSPPKRASAKEAAAGTMVVGCPACHLYVIVSSDAPRCPRCATHVPVNGDLEKRPVFDLNYPVQDF